MSLGVDIGLRLGDFELELETVATAGEVVAVVGPNGCGKSTLLAAIAGLTPITRGEITIAGRVVERAGDLRLPPQARNVGILFQGLALFEHMSALDNVAYGPRARGQAKADARARARAWLERLGLDGPLIERRPSQLSGGQAQRVALARALITEPEVLLLDEPFSSLDVNSLASAREVLAEALADFAGASLLVTHDLDDARALADRMLVLDGGRLVREDPV